MLMSGAASAFPVKTPRARPMPLGSCASLQYPLLGLALVGLIGFALMGPAGR